MSIDIKVQSAVVENIDDHVNLTHIFDLSNASTRNNINFVYQLQAIDDKILRRVSFDEQDIQFLVGHPVISYRTNILLNYRHLLDNNAEQDLIFAQEEAVNLLLNKTMASYDDDIQKIILRECVLSIGACQELWFQDLLDAAARYFVLENDRELLLQITGLNTVDKIINIILRRRKFLFHKL